MSTQKEKIGREEKKKTLVLLDTHAIIHRAYHALPDFTSSSGEPTGALYGLVAMLMKIIRELRPTYIVATYDLPKPTFRHEVYKEYKAGRAKTDDALSEQITRSYDIFRAFSIPIYEASGFEADDIIGTIAHILKKNPDVEVIIASGDMDTLQLVDGKKVRVYTLKKGINDTILYDEKKVEERFGFGPKLLPDYKGLRGDPSDNIIGIAGIGEKGATQLIKSFGTIENMYTALKKGKDVFIKKGFKERIIKLLSEGKEEALFSKVLAQIRTDATITFKLPKKSWKDDVNPHKIFDLFSELGFRTLSQRFRDAFPEQESVIQEEKKEIVDPKEVAEVAIALWLLNSSITNPTIEDIFSYTKTKDMSSAKKKIFENLEKVGLTELYEKTEKPLMPILRKAEQHGVLIDLKKLEELSKDYHRQLEQLEKKIWKLAGEEFNINSPKQLGEILFDKLNLSAGKIKKTAGGARSTRAGELEKLRGTHEIIDYLLSYREFQKLLSTYIDNLPDMVGDDGRLHTTFIQTGTATGRLASNNPNLQNIPIKSKLGRAIRDVFIAGKGFKLVAFDYSQIELRIAAILSKDATMQKILKEGFDVHTATASKIFSVAENTVTKDMRRMAKVINFGILYGMGINALKQNLGTSKEQAQKFYASYFETFPGLAKYLDNTKKQAKKRGFTETFFGRRRYFPAINSPLPYIASAEERQAINAPIQGTSADIIKRAMVSIDSILQEKKSAEDAHLVLQIHDELIYEIREECVEKIAPLIRTQMEESIIAPIPFVVDVSVGYNWGEMKRLDLK